MNLSTVKWALWDKNYSRELLGLFMCVHCTVHNCCAQFCTEQTRLFSLLPSIAPMMSIWGKGSCWLGGRKGIRPAKNWVARYWHGYLSGARCKWFAYGPADATATPSSLAPLKSRMVYLSGAGLPRLSWKKAIKQTDVVVVVVSTYIILRRCMDYLCFPVFFSQSVTLKQTSKRNFGRLTRPAANLLTYLRQVQWKIRVQTTRYRDDSRSLFR